MEIEGTILKIYDTVQISDKFKKRELVIGFKSNGYPQEVLFQLQQDKVSFLDKYKIGDYIEISYNLTGRVVNTRDGERCFNTLQVWRIRKTYPVETNKYKV